jgi:hypothetical protein
MRGVWIRVFQAQPSHRAVPQAGHAAPRARASASRRRQSRQRRKGATHNGAQPQPGIYAARQRTLSGYELRHAHVMPKRRRRRRRARFRRSPGTGPCLQRGTPRHARVPPRPGAARLDGAVREQPTAGCTPNSALSAPYASVPQAGTHFRAHVIAKTMPP